jgi:Tfp pilus assembly protein PilO
LKSSDRTILIGVGVVVLIAAFYMMVLSPKRKEASDLKAQAADLQAQVSQAEAEAASSKQAQTDFPGNYRRLVALGKAVPEGADTPSLLTQLETLSERSHISFRKLQAAEAVTSSGTPAVTTVPTTDPTLASEQAAAMLPIGASVGPAGLPTMPYSLEFQGGFFDIADFLGKVDSMVYTDKSKKVRVEGRLLTIDGFSFNAAPEGYPELTADLAVTSYLTPKAQGATAGATPTGPPTTTPAVAPSTTPAPTPTAGATAATVGAN